MRVRVELAGFGDDRPAVFAGKDEMDVDLPDGAALPDALAAAGLAGMDGAPGIGGLAVLLNGRSVGEKDRAGRTLSDGDIVVVLYAMEGGSPD